MSSSSQMIPAGKFCMSVALASPSSSKLNRCGLTHKIGWAIQKTSPSILFQRAVVGTWHQKATRHCWFHNLSPVNSTGATSLSGTLAVLVRQVWSLSFGHSMPCANHQAPVRHERCQQIERHAISPVIWPNSRWQSLCFRHKLIRKPAYVMSQKPFCDLFVKLCTECCAMCHST